MQEDKLDLRTVILLKLNELAKSLWDNQEYDEFYRVLYLKETVLSIPLKKEVVGKKLTGLKDQCSSN